MVNSYNITHCFVWVLVVHIIDKTWREDAEETGPKWEDMTGAQVKLSDKELHSAASELNIVKVMKSVTMKWARHAVCWRELTQAHMGHARTHTEDHFLNTLKGEVTGKT
jgi:hypothetical protein